MSAKAWFVICISEDTPDGPGEIFGPFPTRQDAEADRVPSDLTPACVNAHLVSFGPGTDRARLSRSEAALAAYRWFYDHPDQIPMSCRHLFRSLFREVPA